MKAEEKLLVSKLYFSQITKEQFLEQYPIDLKHNEGHIYSCVKEAFDNKNADDLSLALTLIIFCINIIYTNEFVELLCLLLKEKWHQEHENIVMMLESIKSPKSVDVLYDTAITKFDYLDYDDSIPLATKCIYALGEINTEKAREKLKLLADSDEPIIKEEAKKQLYYEGG